MVVLRRTNVLYESTNNDMKVSLILKYAQLLEEKEELIKKIFITTLTEYVWELHI